MCFVRLVGHGANCDAARKSKQSRWESRFGSVCHLWYAHRRPGTVYDAVCCDVQVAGAERKGERVCKVQATRGVGVCVCVDWHSTVVS